MPQMSGAHSSVSLVSPIELLNRAGQLLLVGWPGFELRRIAPPRFHLTVPGAASPPQTRSHKSR